MIFSFVLLIGVSGAYVDSVSSLYMSDSLLEALSELLSEALFELFSESISESIIISV